MPYSQDELVELARHCAEKEDDANKVERLVAKSAAAMLLSSRIGNRFEAICTGAADKGTWVRIFQPPIEGRLLYGLSIPMLKKATSILRESAPADVNQNQSPVLVRISCRYSNHKCKMGIVKS